ncbi:MAG: hypothetical protein QM594_12910 [Niabella sp.]
MKKLKLNLQNIEGAEILSREQLKMVIGGNGGSGDPTECETDADCETLTRPCSEGGVQTAIGRCYANPGKTKKTCHYGYGPCVGD